MKIKAQFISLCFGLLCFHNCFADLPTAYITVVNLNNMDLTYTPMTSVGSFTPGSKTTIGAGYVQAFRLQGSSEFQLTDLSGALRRENAISNSLSIVRKLQPDFTYKLAIFEGNATTGILCAYVTPLKTGVYADTRGYATVVINENGHCLSLVTDEKTKARPF